MDDSSASWMDADGKEPDWPTERKALHRCEGCGQERPVDVFDAVAKVSGAFHALLVRCDECRLAKPLTVPYDSKGK